MYICLCGRLGVEGSSSSRCWLLLLFNSSLHPKSVPCVVVFWLPFLEEVLQSSQAGPPAILSISSYYRSISVYYSISVRDCRLASRAFRGRGVGIGSPIDDGRAPSSLPSHQACILCEQQHGKRQSQSSKYSKYSWTRNMMQF